MPTKCSVNGCENYYSKGVPFFDVPSPIKYKFCSKKAELSKKRRKLWLDAMGLTNDSSDVLRICSKHFITGKPAALEKTRDDDWIPTLQMKSRSSIHRKTRSDNGKQRESSNSYPSKKNTLTSKHNISTAKSSRKYGQTELRIVKKGTNGSGLTVAQKHGYFTSDNITVKETALNNKVLRIRLIREDLLDLKRKYTTFNSPSRRKRKEQVVSSFGRQIKRKSHFFEESPIHSPLRKGVDKNLIENMKYSLSSAKTEQQMKNQNEKEKSFIINSKFQSRNVMMKNSSEDASKTLNRVIKKQYRDKIKIKLFPKAAVSIGRAIKNGAVIPKSDKSVPFHREILFVKNYKNAQQWNKTDKTFFLKFAPYRYPEDGTLDYSFQKLVTDVKHMKLPAPSWKIKVIIKQGKISAVTFTNKLTPERCVGFSANSDKYKITIDNKPALLLGSPEHVATSEDLEILLDIIQNIDSKNPMVFYK
ncbi:uncharacterized protein LOC108905382 isoform X2 [Anoplophora glabripennis]|uniref:uncharacterized protein LOC108905382 isoform X2 n=1 Tax=Anoplophora glabripennis TaxID=217634 RepID=UPI00087539E6|nr:uncharacterized protein LOC108905382 isoform X2 [Anoplophora glabripennis]